MSEIWIAKKSGVDAGVRIAEGRALENQKPETKRNDISRLKRHGEAVYAHLV